MTKFIFQPDQKGWLKALGLHHASIALIPLMSGLLCNYFGYSELGAFIAGGGFWWYASREYGARPKPPKVFEIMDFVSPAIVAITYLVAI